MDVGRVDSKSYRGRVMWHRRWITGRFYYGVSPAPVRLGQSVSQETWAGMSVGSSVSLVTDTLTGVHGVMSVSNVVSPGPSRRGSVTLSGGSTGGDPGWVHSEFYRGRVSWSPRWDTDRVCHGISATPRHLHSHESRDSQGSLPGPGVGNRGGRPADVLGGASRG